MTERQALKKCCHYALRRMGRGHTLRSFDWYGCCELMEEDNLCAWNEYEGGYQISEAGRKALEER